MKTFNSLDFNNDELKKIFDTNKKKVYDLSFEQMTEDANWFTDDKIQTLKPILKDYSIGAYNRNYYVLKDYRNFTNTIQEYINTFSGSDDLIFAFESLKEYENKLLNTDDVEKANELLEGFELLADNFFKKLFLEEIESEYVWLENEVGELEVENCFIQSADQILNGYSIDEDFKLYKITCLAD